MPQMQSPSYPVAFPLESGRISERLDVEYSLSQSPLGGEADSSEFLVLALALESSRKSSSVIWVPHTYTCARTELGEPGF